MSQTVNSKILDDIQTDLDLVISNMRDCVNTIPEAADWTEARSVLSDLEREAAELLREIRRARNTIGRR